MRVMKALLLLLQLLPPQCLRADTATAAAAARAAAALRLAAAPGCGAGCHSCSCCCACGGGGGAGCCSCCAHHDGSGGWAAEATGIGCECDAPPAPCRLTYFGLSCSGGPSGGHALRSGSCCCGGGGGAACAPETVPCCHAAARRWHSCSCSEVAGGARCACQTKHRCCPCSRCAPGYGYHCWAHCAAVHGASPASTALVLLLQSRLLPLALAVPLVVLPFVLLLLLLLPLRLLVHPLHHSQPCIVHICQSWWMPCFWFGSMAGCVWRATTAGTGRHPPGAGRPILGRRLCTLSLHWCCRHSLAAGAALPSLGPGSGHSIRPHVWQSVGAHVISGASPVAHALPRRAFQGIASNCKRCDLRCWPGIVLRATRPRRLRGWDVMGRYRAFHVSYGGDETNTAVKHSEPRTRRGPRACCWI